MAKQTGGYYTGGRRHDAPFVMKVRFYDPSIDKEAKAKNAAHVHYIGYRQGVDKGSFEPERQARIDPDSAAGHVGYAHQRPGSHGLFDSGDQPPNPGEIQKELQEHKGIVWRMILSLKETDAVRLGMTSKGAWENALRASIGEAAEKMGIGETNLRWVAAFHDEPGHPHVHLVLWEKNPKRKIGKLSRHETKAVKKEFMKEIYARERMFLNTEKTMMRDWMLGMTKGNVLDKVDLLREVRRERGEIELLLAGGGEIPAEFSIPKIHEYQADYFAKQLESLKDMLPGQGRIAYQFMPPEVKEKLDHMAKWLIDQPQFKDSRERYFGAVEAMTRHYSLKPEDISAALKRAEDDLKKRLAQIILRGAVESAKDSTFRIDPEKAEIVVAKLMTASRRVIDEMPGNVIQKHIAVLRHHGFSETEQLQLLAEWADKADLQLDRESMVQLVATGNHLETAFEIGEETGLEKSQLVQILKFAGRTDEDIKGYFQDKGIEIEEADLDVLLKDADKLIAKAQQTLINERDVTRMMKDLNLDGVGYPWRIEESQEVIAEKSQQAIHAFAEAKCDEPGDRSWTAFTMTVALKHMQYTPEQQREFMERWVERNGYSDSVSLDSIFKSLEKSEKENQEKPEGEKEGPRFLRKPTWERLTSNLGVTLEYPWITKEELVIDPKMLKEAIAQVEAAAQQVEDPKERMWLVQKYVRLIQNDPDHNRDYAQVVSDWEKRHGPLDNEQRSSVLLSAEKRTKDIEHFGKQYGMKDEMYRLVNDFAKVLYTAGLPREQVEQIIQGWKERSGTLIPAEKIDRAIAAAEKHVGDLRAWNREPVMSKKNFTELCRKLGVEDAPWMWRTDKEYDRMSASFSGKLLRTLGNNIVKEMKKNEAQMEMEQRRRIKRIERMAERDEQERGKENRGR